MFSFYRQLRFAGGVVSLVGLYFRNPLLVAIGWIAVFIGAYLSLVTIEAYIEGKENVDE